MKTKKRTTSRTRKLLPFFIFLGILLTLFFIGKPQNTNEEYKSLSIYSENSLKQFNGINLDKPVYIAYEGLVYDVSPGREEFYNQGKPYQYLSGRDSTSELNIAGGAIIKHKYKVVGIYKK